MHINTAYEFTQLPCAWVRKNMTVVGERTWRELHGEPCIEMEAVQPDKQSIMVSRSFGKMIREYDVVLEALSNYACMAAAKLRKQKSCAHSILIFIDTNPYRDDLEQYSRHIIMNFPVATNSSMEIIKFVDEGLRKIFSPGFWYKKAGVMLMDICSQDVIQGNIWDKIDRQKHIHLMEILDCTNDRYGRNALKLAVQGDGKQWKIKQERLSPSYTTRISDFPKVK